MYRMKRIGLLIAVLAGLTLAVYWPVHRFGRIDYDDPTYLGGNPFVHRGVCVAGIKDAFLRSHYANYAPLVSLSYELDQTLFGLRPGPMHVENVLLHLLTGLLLWRFLVLTTGEINLSFVVAALFLCHPMHVESVAWLSERKDVLSTPLLIGAMIAYVRYCRAGESSTNRGQTAGWYGLMVVLFMLSLMCKSMGVTLPGILLLLDFWPLRRLVLFPPMHDAPGQSMAGAPAVLAQGGRMDFGSGSNDARVAGPLADGSASKLAGYTGKLTSYHQLIAEKIPLVFIAILMSIVQYRVQGVEGAEASLSALGIGDRIANALVCYVIYIVKLAVPTDLAVFYPHPGARPMPAAVAAGGLLLLITFIAWRMRYRRPYAIVGWLFFLGTLLPVIGLVQVGAQAMADRYSYLPSLGLFIAVVWLANAFIKPSWGRWIVFLGVIAIDAVLAHRQVGYWQNTRTLFAHATDVTDDNPVAHVELGNVAYQQNDLRTAVDEYQKAKADPHAYSGLGNCWLMDDRAKAIEYYRLALQMRENSAPYLLQLAHALRLNHDWEEAEQLAGKAVQLAPDDPAARAESDRIRAEKPRG